MLSVYLETTIPSYLAANSSRDLVMAAHQQLTHEWWKTARYRFDLFISEAVLGEIRAGDPEAVNRRVEIVKGIPVLALSDDVRILTSEYARNLGLSGRAQADLPHFAFAVAFKMDYLVTWNCRHIANGEIVKRLIEINDKIGWKTPLIVTPEELLGFPEGDES